jgi:hypothetical protein
VVLGPLTQRVVLDNISSFKIAHVINLPTPEGPEHLHPHPPHQAPGRLRGRPR